MTPSAKELGAKIGDTLVVSSKGARGLNELFNLGAVSGEEVIIKDTQIFGMDSEDQIQAEYTRTNVEFALPLDGDFFEEKK